MNVAPCIAYLLFRHDCVIVPGLGGFLAHYVPASYDFSSELISPPRRTVAFNSGLPSGDGLLASFISGECGVSFDTASAWIDQWVLTCRSLLQSGHAVSLDHIGSLQADGERLIFSPLKEGNFYLPTLHFPPVTAKLVSREKERSVVNPQKTVPPIHEEIPQSNFWRFAAVLLPFVLIAGFFTYNYYLNQYAGLSHTDSAAIISITPTPLKDDVHALDSSALTIDPVVPVIDSVAPLALQIDSSQSGDQTSPPPPLQPTVGYYIIIGAFGNPANVEKASKSIVEEFKEANVATFPSNKLTKVGFFAASDLASAEFKLAAARQIQSDCWLYALNP